MALQILHCPQYDKNQRPIDKALRWLPLKLYIMKNLVSLGVFLLILLSVQVNAQEQSVLQIRPTGRILMDGGLFHSDNKNFVDGVAIPDARIGVKATYGKYKAKVDIGYAYGKVSLKDIFVERQFSSHALLRVGNFVHQFGLQSSTSSSMKVTMEEPASNEAFFQQPADRGYVCV